jgi:competence protein ComEC
MSFTLWDVEHGLAIWIKTPAGHNHWIDAGKNSGTDFSPAEHVARFGETSLDYLIISHPDADHIDDLPDVIRYLGEPRVLTRNKTLPDYEKFGEGKREYEQVFRDLDSRYTCAVQKEESPTNPAFNGGIRVETGSLTYKEADENLNDTSIVCMYSYAGWLFVCPGDIMPTGWPHLWQKHHQDFIPLLRRSTVRVLVAPHHGRESGYSQAMMDTIEPHLVLISDEYGQADTHPNYRTKPLGLGIGNETHKYYSTKTSGRVRIDVDSTGEAHVNVQ